MDNKQNNKTKRKTNKKRNKNPNVTNTLEAEDAKLDTIKEVPEEEEPEPQMGEAKEETSELEAEDSKVEYDSEVEREEKYYATPGDTGTFKSIKNLSSILIDSIFLIVYQSLYLLRKQ